MFTINQHSLKTKENKKGYRYLFHSMVTVEVNNPEVVRTGTAMKQRLDEQLMMTMEIEVENPENEKTECAMKWRLKVNFHDTQNENKVLEITPGPKLLDISYNYVYAQDNANTVVSIAPSKPHYVETSTEANFRNEIEPQGVPDSYTTNVDDSRYVEEPFKDSESSYAPSEEYDSDSTSDAMEKAPDEEQESSNKTVAQPVKK
ncbi:hypothetical protein FQA39_LY04900 [Lamprigera yunnana]|nr:hypothetical protein FQA39_LY04900 [Lamprigera yunnana]